MSESLLDGLDRLILEILQSEGRIPMVELADRVHLSATPCTRRVRRLEAMGVILGYGARIDPGALGLPICADVRIKLTNPSEEHSERFEAWARKSDFVDSCHVTTGSWDYVLHIRASTLEAYEAFLKKEVRGAGIDLTLESSIVLRAIKS